MLARIYIKQQSDLCIEVRVIYLASLNLIVRNIMFGFIRVTAIIKHLKHGEWAIKLNDKSAAGN